MSESKRVRKLVEKADRLIQAGNNELCCQIILEKYAKFAVYEQQSKEVQSLWNRYLDLENKKKQEKNEVLKEAIKRRDLKREESKEKHLKDEEGERLFNLKKKKDIDSVKEEYDDAIRQVKRKYEKMLDDLNKSTFVVEKIEEETVIEKEVKDIEEEIKTISYGMSKFTARRYYHELTEAFKEAYSKTVYGNGKVEFEGRAYFGCDYIFDKKSILIDRVFKRLSINYVYKARASLMYNY